MPGGNNGVTYYVQGDHSPWRKPPVDNDSKLRFSIRTLYLNATFTTMSTGGLRQGECSPCTYLGHILTMAFLLRYCVLFEEAVLVAFHALERMMTAVTSILALSLMIFLRMKLMIHCPQNVLTSIKQGG